MADYILITVNDPASILITVNDPDPININIENFASGTTAGTTVEQTIASNKTAFVSGTRHIQLKGEGDAADILTLIEGGTAGDRLTLWRAAGVGYNITITANTNLKLQLNKSFILNSDYDNITLVSKGSDVWAETGGRISPG
jgi:hypothetical protein